MKGLAIAAALMAGTPPVPVPEGCALSLPGCSPGGGLVDCLPEAAPAFLDGVGSALPEGCVWSVGSFGDPPDRDALNDDPFHQPGGPVGIGMTRPGASVYVARTRPAGTAPSRPGGGDPTSIVQRPVGARGTERGSVDNPDRHGPRRPPELPPEVPSPDDPVLPKIIPGPSGPAAAGSKLRTVEPTAPLQAGRRSWAAMVGTAIVVEVALLWLAVGLALRRRGRSRSKRRKPIPR